MVNLVLISLLPTSTWVLALLKKNFFYFIFMQNGLVVMHGISAHADIAGFWKIKFKCIKTNQSREPDSKHKFSI